MNCASIQKGWDLFLFLPRLTIVKVGRARVQRLFGCHYSSTINNRAYRGDLSFRLFAPSPCQCRSLRLYRISERFPWRAVRSLGRVAFELNSGVDHVATNSLKKKQSQSFYKNFSSTHIITGNTIYDSGCLLRITFMISSIPSQISSAVLLWLFVPTWSTIT